MRIGAILGVVALAGLVGCSTSISLKNPDGTTMAGSMMNGAISYSSGPGCKPAQPNPQTPIPAAPAAMHIQQVCQGSQCLNFEVADAAPACNTQLAVVQGNDISSYFGWILAGLGAAAVAVASGT